MRTATMTDEPQRCDWVPLDKPVYVRYHDEEWGVPIRDDRDLFAKLILDGFQAGLSWWSVLSRRDGFYAAFDGLDPVAIADYDENRVAALLEDSRIIRNRQKVRAAVTNAKSFQRVQDEHGSFSEFLWSFVDGTPLQPSRATLADLPAQSKESEAMSRALRDSGFSFVGPTICYAFMQAVGMVNDHVTVCHRWPELARPR